MTQKLMVREDSFTIEVWDWNDFTLDLLKNYTQWKSNGHEKEINDTNNLQEMHNQIMNNNKVTEPKERTLGYSGIPMFPEDQVLARTNKYGNAPMYKPILTFVLEKINDSFSKKEVYTAVQEAYKKHGRNIKLGTAVLYGGSYCKYMVGNKIAIQNDNGNFKKITEEDYTNGITNDLTKDEEEDNWTIDEEELMREQFFKVGVNGIIVKNLLPDKTEEQILTKAKHMGMIF